MSLTNPTPTITACSTMLTSAGLTGTNYYPEAPANATKPFNVLLEDSVGPSSLGLGFGTPPSGTITVYMHRAAALGAVEVEAQSVANAMLALSSGLCLRNVSYGRAEDAHPGDTGADVVCTITINYGVG
jgi:hypothetical protein